MAADHPAHLNEPKVIRGNDAFGAPRIVEFVEKEKIAAASLENQMNFAIGTFERSAAEKVPRGGVSMPAKVLVGPHCFIIEKPLCAGISIDAEFRRDVASHRFDEAKSKAYTIVERIDRDCFSESDLAGVRNEALWW